MITEIIAGVLAGTGWLIGLFLYRWTEEELFHIAKKVKLTFVSGLAIAAALGIISAYYLTSSAFIAVFAVALLASSLYGLRRRVKHHFLLFLVQILAFLVFSFMTQFI